MNLQSIHKEVKIRTSRSSGSGGQHVNKVSTRIELIWDIPNSTVLTVEEKTALLKRLKHRLTKSGSLIITCQRYRSQLRNKLKALEKFDLILNEARRPPKVRKLKPVKVNKAKRLENKRRKAEKKALRKKVIPDSRNDFSIFMTIY